MTRPLIGIDGDLRVDAKGRAILAPESIEAIAQRVVAIQREAATADHRTQVIASGLPIDETCPGCNPSLRPPVGPAVSTLTPEHRAWLDSLSEKPAP